MPMRRDAATLAGEASTDRPAPAESPSPTRAALMLLRLLRAAQPASRAELARRLGVNRSTVTDTFKPLIASGVVREEALQPTPGAARVLGRPASALSFNSDRDFFVGVNLGVRRTQVGLATPGGGLLAEEDFDTPEKPADALTLVRATAGRLRARADGRRLRVLGVSVPGPPDAGRGRVLYAPHLG